MPYQSNDRAVEESYDSSAIAGRLLPDNSGNNSGNINNGASNSAKGSGTTTSELVTKFRLLNCTTSLFVFLFHTCRIVLNPIRFTVLLSSPGKLMLECIVGVLALCLFCVEARVPVLGEKMLRLLARGGDSPCIDLDVARGKVLALMIMGGCLGLINYLGHENENGDTNGGMHSGEGSGGDGVWIPSSNVTDFGEDSSTSSQKDDDGGGGASAAHHMHILYIIVHCIVLSPNTLIVFALAGYTIYVMNAFPEYAEVRAYSIQDGSDSSGAGAASTTSTTTGPSWVSHVGDAVQARIQGGGYQNVGV